MARQSTSPVQFDRTKRVDEAVIMSSGRAGQVVPVTYVPIYRGDAASGRVGVDIDLAEMPRPLQNAVVAKFQAWFVPKSAHPQFAGYDEFLHAYQGEPIKALGQTDRSPPDFFHSITLPDANTYPTDYPLLKTLGIHVPWSGSGSATHPINSDVIDAYNLIWNFRAAAHSSRIPRREYASENLSNSTALAPAFWPSNRFSRVVPDYERALVVGSLDLDVLSGQLPISGLGVDTGHTNQGSANATVVESDGETVTYDYGRGTQVSGLRFSNTADGTQVVPQIFAELGGSTVPTTLADIDSARRTKAFAELRSAYAGNDATGFDNDDAIVAELMRGFRVPENQFKRPWLLDAQTVPFGMVERHATDAANLDQSVSQGRASAMMSLNIPETDTGGTVIVTVEVIPERIYERQNDEWLMTVTPSGLPDALRDVQRPEPVDEVQNRRLDARHASPDGLYGFEAMNDKHQRSFTRLGGAFYQADPALPWTEQRNAIWQPAIVDPDYTVDHFVVPEPFPHDVFSDTTADAFEMVARHTLTISGLTQFGDVLAENNDDYAAVTDETA